MKHIHTLIVKWVLIRHKGITLFTNGLCPIKEYLHNTVVPFIPHPWLYFSWFQLPEKTVVQKQMIFLLMYQKVDGSLMLQYGAYLIHLILPYRVGIFSLTLLLERWLQCNKIFEKRDHIYITFITVYCWNCSIISNYY